jgi:carbonic anhydrase
MSSTRPAIWRIPAVLLTDRLREGGLQVEAASYNLYTTRIDWRGSVLPNRFSC